MTSLDAPSSRIMHGPFHGSFMIRKKVYLSIFFVVVLVGFLVSVSNVIILLFTGHIAPITKENTFTIHYALNDLTFFSYAGLSVIFALCGAYILSFVRKAGVFTDLIDNLGFLLFALFMIIFLFVPGFHVMQYIYIYNYSDSQGALLEAYLGEDYETIKTDSGYIYQDSDGLVYTFVELPLDDIITYTLEEIK
jgi:hypothetical protein